MDDLLQEMISLCSTIRGKKEKELSLARLQIKDVLELRKSASNVSAEHQNASIATLTSEIEKMKVESENKVKDLDKLKKEVLTEKDKNVQMMQELRDRQNETQKVYPRARYAVNMYRDVSRIRWQSDVNSTEVRGFTTGESSSKPFKFDTSKQSQFFITNALWDIESDAT